MRNNESTPAAESGAGGSWQESGVLTQAEIAALLGGYGGYEAAGDGGETEQSAEERAKFEGRGEDVIEAAEKTPTDYFKNRERKRKAKAEAEAAESDAEDEAEEATEDAEETEEMVGFGPAPEAAEREAMPEDEENLSVDEREEAAKKKEMENWLAGREPMEAVRAMTDDLKKLEIEIEGMKAERYFDPQMREYHKRQLEQAMAEYGTMSMRREKILAAMPDEEQEAATFEAEETSPVRGEFDAAGEADANTAEKMSLAAIDQLLANEMGENDTELKRLLEIKREEIAGRRGGEVDETGFAQAESEDAPEAQAETEDERSERYWRTISEMAEEARENPGRWMSEEEKAEMAREEEERERRILEKARKRGGFRRFIKRIATQAGTVVMAAMMALKGGAPHEEINEVEAAAEIGAAAGEAAEGAEDDEVEGEDVEAEPEEDESEQWAKMPDDVLDASIAWLLGAK